MPVRGPPAPAPRQAPSGGGPSISDSYDAGLRAAWELDLWGRNRAALASARASAAADLFDRDGVALTVASGVADTYFQVLSARDRLRIAQANLDNARRVLELVEVRVANGAATPLELAQQRTQVATQSATIPSLRQQERAGGQRAGPAARPSARAASRSRPSPCATCARCRSWPGCRASCSSAAPTSPPPRPASMPPPPTWPPPAPPSIPRST